MGTKETTPLRERRYPKLAEAIARVARDLGRSMPAPRGAPFFGLDMTVRDPGVLDRFSQQGIFRKYQRAIALGGGLGGDARYWAVRFGCAVFAVDNRPSLVAAAHRLNVHAGLAEQVRFQSGSLAALPLGDKSFTHAWSVELDSSAAPSPVLLEAYRVLRPGGFLSINLRGASGPGKSVQRWLDDMRAAGFISIRVETLPLNEPPQPMIYAEQRLRATLAQMAASHLIDLVSWRDGPGRGSAVQLFAERPS